MAISIMEKRAKLLVKIVIALGILAIPFILLLRRMNFVDFGGPYVITVKTYATLSLKEKIHRGHTWFKLASYVNALDVYTDVLFGTQPRTMKRQEYGNLPILIMDQPGTDLTFYRWCMCLSKLNKRNEGLQGCQQFYETFPDSRYRPDIEKLEADLEARRL